MAPLVSIMVAVMGAAEHFEETLLSLLRQSFQDFEIIVLDGGVTEEVNHMLARYASSDERIKVFSQKEPGIAAARNEALMHSSGKYCAVSDADDISLPQRLETQVEFLETHPEVGLCGAWIQTFGAGSPQIRQTPPDDAMIRSQMMFLCPFAHSTVMWRRQDIIHAGQKYLLQSSEDYDLWARLLPHIRFANLPEVLVHYRVHEGQRSHYVEETDRNWQYQVAIRSSLIEMLDVIPTSAEARLHQMISTGLESEVSAAEVEPWLLKLQNANYASKVFPLQPFDKALVDRWWVVCLRGKLAGMRMRRFLASPLVAMHYPNVFSKIIAMLRFQKHALVDLVKRMRR